MAPLECEGLGNFRRRQVVRDHSAIIEMALLLLGEIEDLGLAYGQRNHESVRQIADHRQQPPPCAGLSGRRRRGRPTSLGGRSGDSPLDGVERLVQKRRGAHGRDQFFAEGARDEALEPAGLLESPEPLAGADGLGFGSSARIARTSRRRG